MHHMLPFYGRHQPRFLRLYIFLAKLTGIPLLGRLVRRVANGYTRARHGGYFLTLNEAEQIVDASTTVSLGPCNCRQVFHNCHRPTMTEIVIGAGKEVYSETGNRRFRQILKEEAKETLRRCNRGGMVHTIMHCQGLFYAICSCCPCCCVPLRLRQDYGIEYSIVRRRNIVAEYREQLAAEVEV